MKRNLSVFFSPDHTYLSILESTEKGLDLTYVNSTTEPIDLEFMDEGMSDEGIEELATILKEINGTFDTISVSIPAESVMVSQFPGKPDMPEEEIKQLVDLEIKQAYPQFNTNDFTSTIIPLAENMNGETMMLATIMTNQIVKSCLDLFSSTGKSVQKIEISQINAHNSFLFNYPNLQNKTVAILGVQDMFMDFSIIKNREPVYYNLVALPDKNKLGDVFEAEFNKLVGTTVESIDSAFFFGQGLDKDNYMKVWETSMLLGIEVGRLNSFRMISSSLEQRAREYCSRTMHIFPPCIGAAIPSYSDTIKLY